MSSRNKFITYKGRPLVRCENTLYYGSMADEYVVMMQVMNQEKIKDLDISKKILLKMISTDESVNLLDRIKRTAERDGLYDALDVADVWLTDFNKSNI